MLSDDEKEMEKILSFKESRNTLSDQDKSELTALRNKSLGLDKPVTIDTPTDSDPDWFDAAAGFVKGIAVDMFDATVKNLQLGNLREGFAGTMEEPGMFSPRNSIVPRIIRDSSELGKRIVDTTFGAAEDAMGIYGTVMPLAGLASRFLPGSEAALNKIGINKAMKLADDIFPKTPSKVLYKTIESVTLPADIPKTRQVIADLIAEQGPLAESLKDTVFAKHAESILDLASGQVGGAITYNPVTHTMTQATTKVPKNLPFNQIVQNIQEIGAVVGRMSENKELAARRMKRIYGSMVEDLEDLIRNTNSTAAEKEAGKLYAMARQAYKQELVGAAYEEALNAAIKPVMGNDSFNVDKLLKSLRDDEIFKPFDSATKKGVIEKETYDDIMKTLAKMSRGLDPLDRPSSAEKYLTNKFAMMLAGTAAAGYSMGNNLVSNSSGIALGIWGTSEMMKKLLLHPVGRDFLANTLMQFPPQQQVALAANFINSGKLYDPDAKDYNKRVIEISKDKVMSIFEGSRNVPSLESFPPPSALP